MNTRTPTGVGRCLFEARAGRASHRAVFHRLGHSATITIAALGLTACDEQTRHAFSDQGTAEEALADNRVCLDGVEYFHYVHSLTPHLKVDGKPFTCALAAATGTAETNVDSAQGEASQSGGAEHRNAQTPSPSPNNSRGE